MFDVPFARGARPFGRRGGRSAGAVLGAACLALVPVLPAAAHNEGFERRRSDYIGLWGYRTTCRTANDLMFDYARRTAYMPYETVAPGSAHCRVLTRRGAVPRWELELRCEVFGDTRRPRILRLRQILVMSDGGRRLHIESLNRSTGEVLRMDAFYCRQGHEPELMPLGILEPD